MRAGLACVAGIFSFGAQLSVPSGAALAQARTDSARYQVTLSHDDMRSVHVRASFFLQDSVLLMVPYGMEHLPDGWRTFVHDETVVDAAGRPVPFQRIDNRRWVVRAPSGTAVRMSYVVRIQHDLPPTNWFPGAREAAYVRDWGVFALGRALFVLPGLALTNAIVEFSIPPDWGVAAALPSVPHGKLQFEAATRRDLVDALFFVGDYLSVPLRQGSLNFEFAVGAPFKSSIPLFEQVAKTALDNFRRVFGTDPAKEQYLVVVNPEYHQTDGFGGAFRSGFSMTFPFVPAADNIGVWAFTLTHETFHLWNAYTLSRSSPNEEWLLEGSADYYTILTLARSGVASRERALQLVGRAYSDYRQAAGKVSLAAAGSAEAKSGTLLYKGGTTIVAALDLDIRRKTNDAQSFDDVWRWLLAHRASAGATYRNEDVLQAVNAVSGGDYTAFFERYVTGSQVLDIEPYLGAVGLTINNGRLVEQSDANPAQVTRRNAWPGR